MLVEYKPQQAIWIQPRDEGAMGISWMDPHKIEEILRNTEKSMVLRFIDQAGRQLAYAKSALPPVRVVLGLYRDVWEGGMTTRYTLEDYTYKSAIQGLMWRSRSLMDGKRPFALSVEYAGCQAGSELAVPQAIVLQDTNGLKDALLAQMHESEWREWLP